MSALPECPALMCERTDHDECWRDYARQEDEAKYTMEPPC